MIKYLENKIKGCDELGGMEKEKWAFIQCLKEARKLVKNNVALGDVSNCSCAEQKAIETAKGIICYNCERPI